MSSDGLFVIIYPPSPGRASIDKVPGEIAAVSIEFDERHIHLVKRINGRGTKLLVTHGGIQVHDYKYSKQERIYPDIPAETKEAIKAMYDTVRDRV
jgi:hypothetical protein